MSELVSYALLAAAFTFALKAAYHLGEAHGLRRSVQLLRGTLDDGGPDQLVKVVRSAAWRTRMGA